MKNLLLFLLVTLSLFATAIDDTPPTYYIPAAGATPPGLDYFSISNQTIFVTTDGATNLGGNTYTLTYASLPPANTNWYVIFDATNLSVTTATNVNLFGETPLATYPGIKRFYINFSVVWSGGVPVKKVSYLPSYFDLQVVRMRMAYDTTVVFNDSIRVRGPLVFDVTPSTDLTGTGMVLDGGGKVCLGCIPWCRTGNAGTTPGTNFIGTTDNKNLVFKANNTQCGIIDMANSNTCFGFSTLIVPPSGVSNTAIGDRALQLTASGSLNTGIGSSSLTALTTGSWNTCVGAQSGETLTTGTKNTLVGYVAITSGVSTHDATAIGYNATAANYGIALGSGAGAQPNTFTAAGVRSLYFPGVTSSPGAILIDTSGNGNFVPQQISETVIIPISFESGEQCNNRFQISYPGIVTAAYAVCTKDIAATDDATITLKNASNIAMAGGTITFTAGDVQETSYSVTPTTNNVIVAGDVLYAVSAKATVGGKALLSLTITRTY